MSFFDQRNRRTSRSLALVLLTLGGGVSGCAAAHAPSPTPSPTATPPPQGIPSATGFQNLALVVSLEKETGRPGKLVMISAAGLTPDTGRILPGSSWSYMFADVDRNLFRWTTWYEGNIAFAGPGIDFLNIDRTDIQGALRIDS